MEHDERFRVRNEDTERALRTLATLIQMEVPEGMAFALFLVYLGEHKAAPEGQGAVFWVSNAERAGMIEAVRGWIEENDQRAAAHSLTEQTLEAMEKYGGSFVKNLVVSVRLADPVNLKRLQNAFPEYFEKYRKIGEGRE